MSDPTYEKAKIDANQEWSLAFAMSEIMNDNAPLGWSRYIIPARCLLDAYNITPKAGTTVATEIDCLRAENARLREVLSSTMEACQKLRDYAGSLAPMRNGQDCFLEASAAIEGAERAISKVRAALAASEKAEGEPSMSDVVQIDYTNWRGVRRYRKIRPLGIKFCCTQYHLDMQWIVWVIDEEDGSDVVKAFAMSSIHEWKPAAGLTGDPSAAVGVGAPEGAPAPPPAKS